MSLPTSVNRANDFYVRHGFLATVRRAALGVRRAVFSNRMAIFSCDFNDAAKLTVRVPSSVRIDRIASLSGLAPHDLQRMTSFWNSTLANEHIRERFEKHSLLWLIRVNGSLAGSGWTLRGMSIEPYFFTLAETDIHLFDFHVFPEYRGKGINPLLVNYILCGLASEGEGRALIDVAEWNTAQLSSLRKTPFRQIAWARKSMISHRPTLEWVP